MFDDRTHPNYEDWKTFTKEEVRAKKISDMRMTVANLATTNQLLTLLFSRLTIHGRSERSTVWSD